MNLHCYGWTPKLKDLTATSMGLKGKVDNSKVMLPLITTEVDKWVFLNWAISCPMSFLEFLFIFSWAAFSWENSLGNVLLCLHRWIFKLCCFKNVNLSQTFSLKWWKYFVKMWISLINFMIINIYIYILIAWK